jgi:hypothetical protein
MLCTITTLCGRKAGSDGEKERPSRPLTQPKGKRWQISQSGSNFGGFISQLN